MIEILTTGDNLALLKSLPDKSVQLTFCSPPYQKARTYGIGFNLDGQKWVDWCVERFIECLRVTDGLVAWNVDGQTRNYQWNAAPALLMADLHRRGVKLRRPPLYVRDGTPGSGGPDWLKNRYEWIVCASHGKLPWSDSTAMGHPPKCVPGGAMSNRRKDGSRVGKMATMIEGGAEPKVEAFAKGGMKPGSKLHTKNNGSKMRVQCYTPPDLANPGNLIDCGPAGGGRMGSLLCHQNEAPFPEKLAEFFIRSFCPPGGTVLDPFVGSGTVPAVAIQTGRGYIGYDIRESQIELATQRVIEARAKVALVDPQRKLAI